MFFMRLPESILEMPPGKVCQLYVLYVKTECQSMPRIHNVISIMGPVHVKCHASNPLNGYSRLEKKYPQMYCKIPQIQSRASCRFEDAMKQQNELTYLGQDFVLHELAY